MLLSAGAGPSLLRTSLSPSNSHKEKRKANLCPPRMKTVSVWFITGFSMGSCEHLAVSSPAHGPLNGRAGRSSLLHREGPAASGCYVPTPCSAWVWPLVE